MTTTQLNFISTTYTKFWQALGFMILASSVAHANQDLLESAGIANLHDYVLSDGTLLRGQNEVVTSYEPSNLPSQHDDFYDADGNSRLSIVDGMCGAEGPNNQQISSHPTKSIGLIIGNAANNPNAMGVAPEAQANHLTYETNEEDVLICLSSYGAAVSTYSSGIGVNSSADCNFNYMKDAQTWDSVIYQTGHPVTRSAGNSGTPEGHTQLSSVCAGGFHTLNAQAVGKNIIAVGSSRNAGSVNQMWDEDLDAYVPFSWEFEPAEIGELGLLANSSHGPTTDGRIKPDVTSPVFASDVPTLDNGYESFGNSSAASPTVAGVIALLNQKHRDVYGDQPLDSARAKALLIESILDQGNIGPDYWYGWGSINAEAAVSLIDQDVATNGGHIEELTLSTSNSQADYYFMVDDETEFSVTMAWNDPAAVLGRNRKALVNDMDIQLTDPNGTVYLPYVMPYAVSCGEGSTCDESTITQHATQGIYAAGYVIADEDRNRHDNVEKIQISLPAPIAGPWKLTVSAHSFGAHQSQTVQLVASQMMFADPPSTELTFLSHVPNEENRIVVRAGEKIRFRLNFAAQEGLYIVEYFLRSQPSGVSVPTYDMGPNAGALYIPVSEDKITQRRIQASFRLSEPGLYTYGTRARDQRSYWAGSLVPATLEFQPQTTFYIEVVE